VQFDLVVYSFIVTRASFFLVDQFASAGLHSVGGFVNERVSGRID
jgi:hypothetical protein